MKKQISVSFLLLILAMGCGKIEKMGDNAEAAKDNSGRAADNSGRAADAATQSREEIAYSRLMSRSGATSTSRRNALEAMMKMKSFEMKVTEASKYFKAFEYQLWTGQRYDTSKYLNALKLEAINEFFRSTVEAYGDDSIVGKEINPIRINPKQKDKDLNIMALAVTLHQVHSVQKHITVGEKSNLPQSESMLSIIKKALQKIEKVKSGDIAYSELKGHEQAIYNYRKEALVLLKARVDMLMVMALARVSPLKESTSSGLSLSFLNKKYETRYFKLEIGTQHEVNKYMAEAKNTAEFLTSIGVKISTKAKVRQILEKMKYPNKERLDQMSAEGGTKTLSVQNHQRFLEDLSYFYEVKNGTLVLKK